MSTAPASSHKLQALLLAHWARRPPSWLARLLQPLAWLYRAALALRDAAYCIGLRQPARAAVPVVVVGNLVAGGAGKTPAVMHLVRLLRSQGWTPGVIARGYGADSAAGTDARQLHTASTAHQVGDEALLLHLRCQVPVAVARRRIDAARLLCGNDLSIDILICDDGLQHKALARDLDLIVIDERGFGNGLLLPAGPLRQVPGVAPPARSLVLYNAAALSTPWPGFGSRRQLAGAVELEAWWQGEPARIETLQALRGKPLWAAAGVALPARFFAMLREQGLHFTELPLADHADFSLLPWPREAADVIVTEKDAVKLRPERVRGTRVWVAALDFTPDASFDDALLAALPPRATRSKTR